MIATQETKTMTPKVLRITIELDQDCQDPTNADSQWTVYTFGNNHIVTDTDRGRFEQVGEYDEPTGELSQEILDKLETGLAFGLKYADYSHSSYRLSGSTDGGLLVWEHDASEIGAKTIDERREDAKSFLEEYERWASGECYGYIVERIKSVAPDYDPEDGSHNGAFWEDTGESCWGLIGAEYTREEIDGIIANYPGYKVIFEGYGAKLVMG